MDKKEYVRERGQGRERLRFIAPGIIECTYTLREDFATTSLLVTESQLEGQEFSQQPAGRVNTLSYDEMAVVVDEERDEMTFTYQGRTLCCESLKDLAPVPVTQHVLTGDKPVVETIASIDGNRFVTTNLAEVALDTAFRGRLGFRFGSEEGLYGLGQGEEGIYNYRHHNQYLYQHNMRIPIPLVISSQGYGIFFDSASLMTFNGQDEEPYFFFETVDELRYFILVGENLDAVIGHFRRLTGTAVLLPKYAYGYVQSKEQYWSADELLAVGQEYRQRHVPLDLLVQDWNSWPAGLWGEKKLDPERYAQMAAVNEELHALNIHTMISIWPNMAEGSDNHSEFAANKQLLADYSTYNAFDPAARQVYWEQAQRGLYDQGFDAWWCDSTEPFTSPDWYGPVKREPWERYSLVGAEHKKYLDARQANAYALVHAQGIFEHQIAANPQQRVLNLTRSGYAGSQKYGVMLWSGDIDASWQTLQQQITEGLNMCLSGMPYWTLDIGAFFVVGSDYTRRGCGSSGNPDKLWFWQGDYNQGVADLGYRELYTRWFEYGTFLPMQRSHGTDTPREIWQFGNPGEPFYDAILKYIRLRYQLMVYIYSLAGKVSTEHYTMMRSLLFDFAEDAKAREIHDGFMFGPSLLVYPVTTAMYYGVDSQPLERAKTWECYLPAGATWYHYWTNHKYEGGQTVVVEAPLGEMPLFVKGGSILPLIQDELAYAGQRPEQPLVLKVYPGADATFSIYEDDETGYAYQAGAYAVTKISWDEEKREGQIGERLGHFAQMPPAYQYVWEIVGE